MGGAEGRGREAGGGPALHHREHLESVLVMLADPERSVIVVTVCENAAMDPHFTCGAVSLFLLQIFASPGPPVFVFALKFY